MENVKISSKGCENMLNFLKKKKDAAPKAPKEPLKKRLLKLILHAAITLLVLVLVLAGGVFLYARHTKTNYQITFYQETSKKVSQNIRFAVISDLHNREYGQANETLISDLRSLQPDFILFAGDLVTKTDAHYEPMLELVSHLSEVAPCYGVLGNHESERIYYYGGFETRRRGVTRSKGYVRDLPARSTLKT